MLNRVAQFAESMRYAAIAYFLSDTGNGQLVSGPSFFKEAGEKLLRTALETLYEQTLNGWHHQERAELAKTDLAALYRDRLHIPSSREATEEARQRVRTLAGKAQAFSLVREIVRENGRIEIAFTNGENFRGPDPLTALSEPRLFSKQPAIIASTFGGIRSGAIMISPEGRPFPVDLLL